jgi:xanthine dehydrogenase iron-sulfur cluster and FAD-binding subunit A
MQIEFTVNGQPQTVEADPRETLLFVLREHLGLRGTKYGCGEGECGACTVILNGRAVASCLVQAGQTHGAQILTIEGMAEDPIGRHVLEAFVEGGAVQIQNVGTLAGNLVNGSPAADAVPPLIVLDAVAVLRSVQGERRVPVVKLATGPGQTSIAPDEILTQVIIPKPKAHTDGEGKEIVFFEKLGPRKAQTIAIASVALLGWLGRGQGSLMDVRVALGVVAPTVMLTSQTAGHLMGGPLTEERILEAGEIAAQECQPIDDVRGSAAYRRRLVRGLLVRGLWPHNTGRI